MTLVVIGLTGAAGSGKSTVARRLVDEWAAHRAPFAGPLKRMLRSFLEGQGVAPDVALRMTDGDLKEAPADVLGGETPRRAMQTLGDWGRALHPDLWVDAWGRAIDHGDHAVAVDGSTVLISADDTRYPNEVEAIRARDGLIVRVDRHGAGLTGAAGAHSSETSDLGASDQTIVNGGSIEDLHAQADAIAANVMD